MWITRQDEVQAGIKIAGKNINNFRYADDITLMAESEEKLKSLLMKVNQWKTRLKMQYLKMKIMASSSNFMANRWGKCEKSIRFHFLGLQNHCSHKLKDIFFLEE